MIELRSLTLELGQPGKSASLELRFRAPFGEALVEAISYFPSGQVEAIDRLTLAGLIGLLEGLRDKNSPEPAHD